MEFDFRPFDYKAQFTTSRMYCPMLTAPPTPPRYLPYTKQHFPDNPGDPWTTAETHQEYSISCGGSNIKDLGIWMYPQSDHFYSL